MIRYPKNRIYYEGMIDFLFEDRAKAFAKSLKKSLTKYCYPVCIYIDDRKTVVFHCIAYVNRKSHDVDEAIKSVVNRYKSIGDIGAIRIDKCYTSRPIMLYAFVRM